jgi:hypothetical protein
LKFVAKAGPIPVSHIILKIWGILAPEEAIRDADIRSLIYLQHQLYHRIMSAFGGPGGRQINTKPTP